ncbi:aldo/keto reductase [Candidatus Laterigemmans baculatus]|uniref:aldo/keto reductase n=1 Tax=Candidatus Laterigemmans baculatus TaxID=2770505 RepID=UPI0013DD1B19|nr:aldo/keto reductase [Candidatus Laterigemmans baculatus]
MPTRRTFLSTAAFAAAASTLGTPASGAPAAADEEANRAIGPAGGALPMNESSDSGHYRPPFRIGLGGVAIGTAFAPLTGRQSDQVMQAAWDSGVRYFDTSPWYGLGVSERRMAHFLADQPRNEYVISTKIGRILTPAEKAPETMWKAPSPFDFHIDYTAEGTRRSVEESLHRMGLSRLDIVFIHDLSPDYFGDKWTEHFETAAKGAMPELTRMRDEGIIKAWGFGVNTIEPCLRALEVADPDLFLLATQYSVVDHEDALNRLFPKCDEQGVSIVVGAPLNSGYLAGKERYNYQPKVPPKIREKGERISAIAREHGVDLRTVALQFCSAPKVVSSVIPGASTGEQVIENVLSVVTQTPTELWEQLKRERLIAENAPVPV